MNTYVPVDIAVVDILYEQQDKDHTARVKYPDFPLDEMDYVLFKYRGFLGYIMRAYTGAWCGYVVIPQGHPWLRLDHEELEEAVDVHGGITWNSSLSPMEDESRTGKLPNSLGRHIGFDCAHAGDYVPAISSSGGSGTYKTQSFAMGQVLHLISQAENA